MRSLGFGALVVLALATGSTGCEQSLDEADFDAQFQAEVEVYFNYPGSREANATRTTADDVLVQMIERAQVSIDFAVMGFSRRPVVDALVRAHHRGVRLRFAGDGRHMAGNVYGYEELDAIRIETQIGNQNHIMHDKFFVFDSRFVLTGTGNITPTGFNRNDNNWILIDSPQVAADFTAEIEQMLAGRFGYGKERIDNGNRYRVGQTNVEVWFSPQEDAMGRMLEGIEEAQESIEFFIFAFTKDQVGSALIAKHLEFEQYNQCCDPSRQGALDEATRQECGITVICRTPFREKFVRGVIDRSQLHSNGPYHEVYRLLSYGMDLVQDGNDNSRQPGDYQAGGGRQHSKTMVIDARTEAPVILTGSFNWSSSATLSNDETLVVVADDTRISAQYAEYFEYLFAMGKAFGVDYVGDGRTEAGSVVFNEIHWDGYNGEIDISDAGGDLVYNDEFIELLNTTDRTIDLSMWTIAHGTDFVVGLYPGTVIGPYERFLLLDHNTDPYDDLRPQFRGGAFQHPDFVMNNANDPRFLRLNLRNAHFELRLIDPRGTVIDQAGDGGPAFAGGRTSAQGVEGGVVNRSMERVHPIIDGRDPDAWRACSAPAGGENVREAYRSIVIATPGEPNSGGEAFPAEDPRYRSASGTR